MKEYRAKRFDSMRYPIMKSRHAYEQSSFEFVEFAAETPQQCHGCHASSPGLDRSGSHS